MNRTQIAPGVFLTEIAGEPFKRSLLMLHLVVPADRDKATAQALLPHLLERRCAAIPDPTVLSRRLSGLYGAEITSESYAAGDARVVSIGISGLKNSFALEGEDLAAEYMELLCQLLFDPKLDGHGWFEAEDVAIEKEKQADFLKSEMNDKRTRCIRQARRVLFGDSILGLESAGYLEDIPGLTPQMVTEVYHDLLRQAEIDVVVCGAAGAPLAEQLSARLAAFDRKPEHAAVRGAVLPGPEMRHYEEPMDTAQGKLCILCTSGQVADVRSAAVMRVAAALLGGLPSSRLFTNVREKQGLCYYCAASFDTLKNVLTIDSGVDHANAEKASEAILHELRQMQQQPVTEQEMAFAHLALQNAFRSAADNPDALAGWVFSEQLRGSNMTLKEAAALVASVTREEVQQALAQVQPAVEYVITQKEEGGVKA